MVAKIYLVVLEANKTSVTTASFNQFTAQKLCHMFAEKTKIPHAVVTEDVKNVTFKLLKDLKQKSPRFNKEFDHI